MGSGLEPMAIVGCVEASATLAVFLSKKVIQLRDWYKDRKPKKELTIKGSSKTSVDEMRRKAREKLGINSVDDYNFAIAGRAMAGKTTLIYNMMGGRRACREHGLVPDTPTDDIQAYRHWAAGMSHVVFWDMPGAGTPEHPAHSYFLDNHLYAFDFLVIVTDARFMEYDFQLVRDARDYNVPVVFLRNKADVDITNYKASHKHLSDAEVIAAVRESCRRSFFEQAAACGVGADCRLFTISASALSARGGVPLVDEEDFLEYVGEVAYRNRN